MNAQLEGLRSTAYHEAGHAVMAFLTRRPFIKVTIIPDEDGSTGSVRYSEKYLTDLDLMTFDPWSCRTRSKIEKEVMVSYAGQIAEEEFAGKLEHLVYQDDVDIAKLVQKMVGTEEEAQAYQNWLYLRSKNVICHKHNWPLVEALAEELSFIGCSLVVE